MTAYQTLDSNIACSTETAALDSGTRVIGVFAPDSDISDLLTLSRNLQDCYNNGFGKKDLKQKEVEIVFLERSPSLSEKLDKDLYIIYDGDKVVIRAKIPQKQPPKQYEFSEIDNHISQIIKEVEHNEYQRQHYEQPHDRESCTQANCEECGNLDDMFEGGE